MSDIKLIKYGIQVDVRSSVDTNRNPYIDCIKGIAIILMVVGHSGFQFSNWIYLFHMQLFFLCSGYCYVQKNINMFNWTKKKLHSLWWPNFVSVLLVSAFTNALLDLHIVAEGVFNRLSIAGFIKDILKAFLFGGAPAVGSQLVP